MNNTNTNTNTEIVIFQPEYLFMIVFFGCWWLMCIPSMFIQIDKCCKKRIIELLKVIVIVIVIVNVVIMKKKNIIKLKLKK